MRPASARMPAAPFPPVGQSLSGLPQQAQSGVIGHELALSTVTARRFCDQHEMSLHTATGRSLP
jgi:hypothetical protein